MHFLVDREERAVLCGAHLELELLLLLLELRKQAAFAREQSLGVFLQQSSLAFERALHALQNRAFSVLFLLAKRGESRASLEQSCVERVTHLRGLRHKPPGLGLLLAAHQTEPLNLVE